MRFISLLSHRWWINIFQFINLSYGWLEKVYKHQFHLSSIFEQQMGLISFIVSLHYNLSPFDSPIFSWVNRIECPSWIEEKKIIVWSGWILSHIVFLHQERTHIIFMILSVSWWMRFSKFNFSLGMSSFHIVHIFVWISNSKLEWFKF